MVIVPEEDRFTPFEITVFDGDLVDFVNNDTDDQTVVSDDAASDGGPRHIDLLLPGTESNGDKPGKVSIRFGRPGPGCSTAASTPTSTSTTSRWRGGRTAASRTRTATTARP